MLVSKIISKCNLNEQEIEYFTDYIKNPFKKENYKSTIDNSFIDDWELIYNDSHISGVEHAINNFLSPRNYIHIEDTSKIKIDIYKSICGLIPIIYIKDFDLFENLITNVVYKGISPSNISTIGAAFVFGKSNRFIILSNKPYSNVPASDLGLSLSDWRYKSSIIRREHECTHYFTKIRFGISRNHIQDELLADFFGINEAFGYYKADYFQRFMGINGYKEGRLAYYISNLSPNLCKAISFLAIYCSQYLEEYSKSKYFNQMEKELRIKTLCLTSITEMLEYK